jgi:pilus assembly protein Flp/PilA
MLGIIKGLLADENGATAIEYGFIAALVSTAAIASLSAMGTSLETLLTGVASDMSTALTQAGG